jgi:hypothetical protein
MNLIRPVSPESVKLPVIADAFQRLSAMPVRYSLEKSKDIMYICRTNNQIILQTFENILT